MGFRERLASVIAGRPIERKQLPNGVMGAIISAGSMSAKWMDINYENVAKEGYGRNPYVHAAIRQIAETFAGIPWRLFDGPEKDNELTDHPLIALLNRPNETMGRAFFFENLSAYLDMDGNSFIQALGPRPGAPPTELWPLRPDRVQINLSGNPAAPIQSYTYRVGNAKVDITDVKSIRHIKLFNPLHDFRGMSPMSAAAMSIVQSNWSKQWNVAMLQNAARPTGAWVTEHQLDPEQHSRLKEQLTEDYAGFMNAARPLLVEGGAKWTDMGLSPVDMAWLEGQRLSAREIAIVYGIAPELIGDSTNKTFSNYQEARKALYQEKALPRLDVFKDEFNAWLCPMFGKGLYLDYDKEEIEALQEDRNALWQRVDAAFLAGYIQVDEAREAIGLEALKGEWGDKLIHELPQRQPPAPASPPAAASSQRAGSGGQLEGGGAGGGGLPAPAGSRVRVTEQGGEPAPAGEPSGAPSGPPQLPAPAGGTAGGVAGKEGGTTSASSKVVPFPRRDPGDEGNRLHKGVASGGSP